MREGGFKEFSAKKPHQSTIVILGFPYSYSRVVLMQDRTGVSGETIFFPGDGALECNNWEDGGVAALFGPPCSPLGTWQGAVAQKPLTTKPKYSVPGLALARLTV